MSFHAGTKLHLVPDVSVELLAEQPAKKAQHIDLQDLQDFQDSQDPHGVNVERSRNGETLAERISAAVEATSTDESPSPDNPWRTPLWDFVDEIKGHAHIRRLNDEAALHAVRTEIFRSFPEADREAPLASLFPRCNGDEDFAEEDFLRCWTSNACPKGERLLFAAFIDSAELANELVREGLGRENYAKLLALAARLQEIRRADCILLPVRAVADLLGVDSSRVSRYIDRAVRQGLLDRTAPCRFDSKNPTFARRATEFRFNEKQFDAIRRRMANRSNVC